MVLLKHIQTGSWKAGLLACALSSLPFVSGFAESEKAAMVFEISQQVSDITITGRVVDENDEPLIGANIKVLGGSSGTISDLDGNFSLKVSAGSRVEVTYIGYKSVVVTAGRKQILVRLEPASEVMDEVVVVGYGVQKKASVVGAISTISTKDLTQSASSNLGNALAGKLPGLTTVQTSGQPGNDDPAIYIRGRATWVNSQPLYIVDGIERSSITNIDANEIESISILKDASATAVYGVRGANGVVIVTTRRGTVQKPEVSLSARVGFQVPTRTPQFLRSYETAKLKNEAIMNDYYTDVFNLDGTPKMSVEDIESLLKQNGGFDREDLAAFASGTADPYYYPDVDWWDEMVRSATPQQQYNINIKGGTNRARYFVSAGYLKQEGIFKTESSNSNFNFERFNLRSNIDLDITKDLTFSINLAARVETKSEPDGETWNSAGGVFYAINRIAPYETAIINPDGRPGFGVSKLNAWATMNKTGNKREQSDVLETNFALKYNMDRFVKGLSFKAQFSYDSDYRENKAYGEKVMWSSIVSVPGQPYEYAYQGSDQPYNFLSSSTETSEKTYLDLSLYYERMFGKHNVTGLFLYNQSNNITYVTLDIPYRYQGLVARATYNYDQRYFAEFNMGYNGSENFAKGHRFGFFPSFSLGWMLSEEPFFKKMFQHVDMLKIRGSYGLVGNDQIGGSRFLYLQDFVSETTYSWSGKAGAYFGPDAQPRNYIYESMAANPNVTWEKAAKTNIGLELMVGNGLFGMNADFFHEKRKDILMQRQTIASFFGADAPAANVGETTNQGFELELSHRMNVNNNFSYWLKGNVSYAHNKVISKDEPINKPAWQKEEGHRIGQFQGYIVEGFFKDWEEIENSPLQIGAAPHPGDLKYRDVNNDGQIDEKDVTYIGRSDVPELNFGLSFGFNWKGLDFSALFQGAALSNMWLNDDLFFEFTQGAGKLMEHHRDRWAYYQDPFTNEWVDTRETATYPRLNNGTNPNRKNNPNSYFLLDNKYLKLRNLEIGYTFDQQLIKPLGLSQVRVYVSGNNLFCLSKVKQWDPEGGGSQSYPQMKIYSFGVNVTF